MAKEETSSIHSYLDFNDEDVGYSSDEMDSDLQFSDEETVSGHKRTRSRIVLSSDPVPPSIDSESPPPISPDPPAEPITPTSSSSPSSSSSSSSSSEGKDRTILVSSLPAKPSVPAEPVQHAPGIMHSLSSLSSFITSSWRSSPIFSSPAPPGTKITGNTGVMVINAQSLKMLHETEKADDTVIHKKSKMTEEQIRVKREKRMMSNSAIWKESSILRKWETKKKMKKTRALIWQGVPPHIRTIAWPLFVGNALHLTQELFGIYVSQAERTLEMKKRSGEKDLYGKEGSVSLIPLDLPRTFPGLSVYQVGGPYHEHLKSVLEAYVCYRPDIGYVQGMSYLAALLLLSLDPCAAFIALANLLNRPLMLGFYRMDMKVINGFSDVLFGLLAIHIPRLHARFTEFSISADLFVIDWSLTFFAKALPLEVSCRLWDVLLYEGEIFFFRACLALLLLCEPTLLKCSFDRCLSLLTHFPEFNESEVFSALKKIKLDAAVSKPMIRNYLASLGQ